MVCARESLLTKVTRVPGGTVSSFGLTPDDVIVRRVALELEPLLDPPEDEGAVGELPPQARKTTVSAAVAAHAHV